MASAHLIDSLDSRKAKVALVAGSLPVVIAATGPPGDHAALFFAGVAVAVGSGTVVNTVGRRWPWLWYLAVYGGLLGLFAMQAHTGGVASGYVILLLPIVIWFATEFDDGGWPSDWR